MRRRRVGNLIIISEFVSYGSFLSFKARKESSDQGGRED